MFWLTTKHHPAYTDVPGDWTDRRGKSNDGPALGIGDEDGVVIEGATAADIGAWLRTAANRIDPAGARAVAAGAIRDAVSTICNGEQLHDEHVRYCLPLLEQADLIEPWQVGTFTDAVRAANKAVNGASRDVEIEALWGAVNAAADLLGVTREETR